MGPMLRVLLFDVFKESMSGGRDRTKFLFRKRGELTTDEETARKCVTLFRFIPASKLVRSEAAPEPT